MIAHRLISVATLALVAFAMPALHAAPKAAPPKAAKPNSAKHSAMSLHRTLRPAVKVALSGFTLLPARHPSRTLPESLQSSTETSIVTPER